MCFHDLITPKLHLNITVFHGAFIRFCHLWIAVLFSLYSEDGTFN